MSLSCMWQRALITRYEVKHTNTRACNARTALAAESGFGGTLLCRLLGEGVRPRDGLFYDSRVPLLGVVVDLIDTAAAFGELLSQTSIDPCVSAFDRRTLWYHTALKLRYGVGSYRMISGFGLGLGLSVLFLCNLPFC